MIEIKTKLNALVKVWLPIILTPIVIFLFFNRTSSYITVSILQLLIGVERKEIVLEICSYLNTNFSLILSFIITLQLLSIVRKKNNEQVFNSNGNIYYDHWYVTFFLASKILGYKKIQLAGIPIAMQFKIVLRGTFAEVIEDVWNEHYENSNNTILSTDIETVEVEKLNMEFLNESSKINLLICDTHLIDMNEIDNEFRDNPTIIIKSTVNKQQIRYLNKPLVNEVRKNVQLIPRDKELYVFSTANPKNNLSIITSSFRFFDRFPIKNVYVVQYGVDKKYRKAVKII